MVKLYRSGGRADLACPKAGDGNPHMEVQFVWQEGCEHVEHHAAELTCPCGQLLIHTAGTDPWKHPFIEVEGVPHGA